MLTPPLFDPEKTRWHIKHQLPGRVRLEGAALHADTRLAKGIRTALIRLPGVTAAEASAASGTVLVVYNESLQSIPSLIECIRHAHRARNKTPDTLEDREIQLLRSTERTLAAIDARLRQETNGRLSLRKLALCIFSGRTALVFLETGFISAEAARAAVDVALAWILFKHPRLERELEKVSDYVHPGA